MMTKISNLTEDVFTTYFSLDSRGLKQLHYEKEVFDDCNDTALMLLCIPASAQHEFVDLGLSVKWATCNVGASKPEEVDGFFAWGETETKSDYSYSTYKFSSSGSKGSYTKYSNNDNKTVLDPEDDVAHVKWGSNWRMPTWEEMQELIRECTWTGTEVKGIEGFRFTSKKAGYEDRSIFLPVNQYSDEAAIAEGMYPAYGAYWSSTLCQDRSMIMMADRDHAWGFLFCRDYPLGNGSYRNEGRSIRPVCK